ncbi:MAG: hypothetical protein HFI88_11110 [Lachnospiraceae bacterium]|nr:hypothetical protein [Lachnospiraceae bacterium]
MGGEQKAVFIQAENEDYALCAVVMARFQKRIINSGKVRKEICEQMKKKEASAPGIEWNAFYSLGAEDMVFLVVANDITEIQSFVDLLITAEIDGEGMAFLAVSSYININDISWRGNLCADLIMRLNLKSGKETDVEAMVKMLENEGIHRKNIQRLLLGKCVLDIRVPADKVKMEWYSKEANGIFNGENPFYKKYIASSRSYWCVEKENSI